MVRQSCAPQPQLLDTELLDLPPELRWREWMTRVEAVIFAASGPVEREVLARLVGRNCSVDLLIEDISAELVDRPYEIVSVAGGWQFRTRRRYADVLQAVTSHVMPATNLTETEILVLAAIAYHQPVTRARLSEIIGREVSRDMVAQLRHADFISNGPRAPRPGAPFSYVTTKRFLEHFDLQTLSDLPAIETLEDGGLLDASQRATDDLASMPRMGSDQSDDD